MRSTRAITVVLAGVAVLAGAALLAWRAHEHGPGPDADPRSTARPAPTDEPEKPPALLEAKGSPSRTAPSPAAKGEASEGKREAPGESGAAAAPTPGTVPVVLRLTRSDGGTVDQARVRLLDYAGFPEAWDPRTGLAPMPAGNHVIEVLAGRFGEWRQPEDLQIEVRAGMAPLEITLRPWRMIVGHLNASEGGPAIPAGALLRGIKRQDGEEADHRDECKVELRPPSDGWFTFGQDHELDPGTYEVSATSWVRGPVVATREVVVTDRAVVVEIDLPRRSRSDGVTLKIEDPEGRPLAPTALMIDVIDDQGGGGGGGATFERLEEGRYWLPTVLPGYSGRTPVSITAWVQSAYGERRVDMSLPTSAKDVAVRFEVPARLALTLTHRTGWLAETDRLEIWRIVRNGKRLVARGKLQESGTAHVQATFEGIQPGDYWIAAHGKGERSLGLRIALAPVSLKAGENTLEVAAPPLHPLQVQTARKGPLHFRADDTLRSGGTLNWGEAAETVHLPAGRYTLSSWGSTVTVEVPGTSEVTLEK